MRTALRERVDILREAHRTGETGILVLHMQVGENRQPFPEEYAKPAPPIWRQAGIYVLGSQTYSATIRYEAGASRVQAETGGAVSPEGIYGAEMTTSPVEPEFKQGALEREAYNLLLQTHGTLESMVKGEVAALSFKNWSAARIEEGKYLVRVTFNKDSEETNRDYIWSVNLASKDVVALSAYARSIAK